MCLTTECRLQNASDLAGEVLTELRKAYGTATAAEVENVKTCMDTAELLVSLIQHVHKKLQAEG